MSATVGPSQRVCSSPTLVSTTTGARSTPVASWRPPRPASTTATSTPRRASSSNAAAVISSNWVTRSPGSRPRSTFGRGRGGPLHRRAECLGLEVAVADPDPLREARQVRRDERAGAHAVRLQQRRGHPHGRALAVGADHVDRAEALLRRVERGQQPPHALQAEAHAEQLEPEQVLLGALRGPRHRPACSSRSRASFVALGLDHRGRRLGDEAVVGQLLLRARDLRLQPAAPLVDPARGRTEVDGVGRQHRDRAAGHGDRGGGVAAVGRPVAAGRAARRARPCARSPRPPAARAAPRRAPRRSGRASRAAPARRRSRAPAPPRRPRRSATRRPPASAAPSAGRRRPGYATTAPRSRTGSRDGRSRASRRSRRARSG